MLRFKMVRESFIAVLIVLLSTVLGLDIVAKADNEHETQAHSQAETFEIHVADERMPLKDS